MPSQHNRFVGGRKSQAKSFGASSVPAAAAQRDLAFVSITVIEKIQDSSFILTMEESAPERIRVCVLKGREGRSNLTAVTIPRVKRSVIQHHPSRMLVIQTSQ